MFCQAGGIIDYVCNSAHDYNYHSAHDYHHHSAHDYHHHSTYDYNYHSAYDYHHHSAHNYRFSTQDSHRWRCFQSRYAEDRESETVEFENLDHNDHKIICNFPFTTTIIPDGTFDFIFDKSGTYLYWDEAAPLVKGIIIVADEM